MLSASSGVARGLPIARSATSRTTASSPTQAIRVTQLWVLIAHREYTATRALGGKHRADATTRLRLSDAVHPGAQTGRRPAQKRDLSRTRHVERPHGRTGRGGSRSW